MVPELDIGGTRLVGRRSAALAVEVVRDMEESDLALLASERGTKAPSRVKLRDRHHALARALANGMTPGEASAFTGYTPSTVSILQSDPAFKELLSHYRDVKDAAFAEFQERAALLSIAAVTELHDRLENEDDPISTSTVIEIVKLTADRTGHAPVSRSVSVSVSADLGSRLQAATRRLRDAGES
jgi:hypothetical protein